MIFRTILYEIGSLVTVEGIVFTVSFQVILYFVLKQIISEKIRLMYSKKLEDYKFEMGRREKAAKIASLFAERFSLSDYSNMNQIMWELSLWLPEKEYKDLISLLKESEKDDSRSDPRKMLIDLRTRLQKPGVLSVDDIHIYGKKIKQIP